MNKRDWIFLTVGIGVAAAWWFAYGAPVARFYRAENAPLQPSSENLAATAVIEVIATSSGSFAFLGSGEVYAWGSNYGLFGDFEHRLTPTKVPALRGMKAIAAGSSHSLALSESGEVYAWGDNGAGQLGLGDTEPRFTPTKVPALSRAKASAAGR